MCVCVFLSVSVGVYQRFVDSISKILFKWNWREMPIVNIWMYFSLTLTFKTLFYFNMNFHQHIVQIHVFSWSHQLRQRLRFHFMFQNLWKVNSFQWIFDFNSMKSFQLKRMHSAFQLEENDSLLSTSSEHWNYKYRNKQKQRRNKLLEGMEKWWRNLRESSFIPIKWKKNLHVSHFQ